MFEPPRKLEVEEEGIAGLVKANIIGSRFEVAWQVVGIVHSNVRKRCLVKQQMSRPVVGWEPPPSRGPNKKGETGADCPGKEAVFEFAIGN